MSERAFPVHCPYCGDENLRPHEVVAESGEVASAARHLGVPGLPARPSPSRCSA